MQVIKDQFNAFLQRGGIPILEYPIKFEGESDYLAAWINVTDQGVTFKFDTLGLPTYFDGETVEILDGCYLVPFDDCFTDLDYYLQYIDEDIRVGFIDANGIYDIEADQ